MVSTWIAQTHRAMPDLKANDKWPNIDGYVELTDENGFPLGTIQVQIKKLSKTSSKTKRHTFKSDKFLSYCRESSDWIPIIFIGVDIDAQKAFWLHVDKESVLQLKGSKTISLDTKQLISPQDKDFIQDWERIIQYYRTKSEEFEKYKQAFTTLSGVVTPALGVTNDRFVNIHRYLDKLNSQLDGDFKAVKNLYYPNTWKLGVGYYVYEPKELIYSVYPIATNKNDVQIKELDDHLFGLLREQGLGFSAHSGSNPIDENPESLAIKEIKSQVTKVVERRLLNHSGDILLAREYVIAFIDKFHVQMGLAEKDEYALDEVLFSFSNYLPHWLNEAYQFLKHTNRNNFNDRLASGRIRYYDPDWLGEIMTNERESINDRVAEKIAKKSEPPSLPIGNERMPLGLFAEFLEYLKKESSEIKRVYRKRDLTRNVSKVSDFFTLEDTKYNFSTVVENFSQSYQKLLTNNFPTLDKELSLFGSADTIFADFSPNDVHPTYSLFYLKSSDNIGNEKIQIADETTKGKLQNLNSSNRNVSINGKEYTIISSSHSSMDFVYKETPLLDLSYDLLKNRFKYYFDNIN